MCPFGLSGCRVKPRRPHQTGPPGLAHDSPRTPNRHISGPLRFKNSTRIPRKDPQEREERKKIVAEKEKKARNFGPPTLRGPTLRCPTLSGFGPPTLRGPHPSGPLPLGAHPSVPHPSGPHPSGAPLFGAPPFGAPPFGAPPFGAPPFLGLGSHLSGPTRKQAHTLRPPF